MIKQLMWRQTRDSEGATVWKAEALGLKYTIIHENMWYEWYVNGATTTGLYSTIEEARAIAQHDWESRLLSCLDTEYLTNLVERFDANLYDLHKIRKLIKEHKL